MASRIESDITNHLFPLAFCLSVICLRFNVRVCEPPLSSLPLGLLGHSRSQHHVNEEGIAANGHPLMLVITQPAKIVAYRRNTKREHLGRVMSSFAQWMFSWWFVLVYCYDIQPLIYFLYSSFNPKKIKGNSKSTRLDGRSDTWSVLSPCGKPGCTWVFH